MSIVTVGRHIVHYEALGHGRPVVLVHGWLGTWRYWWPTMQVLSATHRTYAMDLWGFGQTSKVESNYSFEAMVTLVEAFVEKLGIVPPYSLVGHGAGGAVALWVAQRQPEKVASLSLIAMPTNGRQIDVDSVSDSVADPESGTLLHFPEVGREVAKCDPAAARALARELSGFNFSYELERCRCPILFVAGQQDVLVRPDDEATYRTRDNHHRVMLADSGHFPMLDQPMTFNRLLLDFLLYGGGEAEIAPKEYWQRRTR
ncbi:MAG: alpha/beta fold hydrolase [Candidatus Promineifilaceae bacterium]|nr:alpha/beta fold hydrolase [Candidatus Promineifilaceae bacterium]